MASRLPAHQQGQDDEEEEEEGRRRRWLAEGRDGDGDGDGGEEGPLIIGYPVIRETVEGQPVYAFLPSGPPPPPFPSLSYSPERIRRRWRCRACVRSFVCFLLFLILLGGVIAFFIWPRSIKTLRVNIDIQKVKFSIDKEPSVSFDLDLDLSLRVRNPNYFTFEYDNVVTSVLFQGDEIDEPEESAGGLIEAFQTSSVSGSLEIDGYQILNNVSALIVDIAKGLVPLEIVSVFDGYMDIIWFQLPVEGKVTCNIVVDPENQALRSQDCS